MPGVTELPDVDAKPGGGRALRAEGKAILGGGAGRLGVDAVLHFCAGASAVGILLMIAALVVVLFHAAIPSIQTFGAGFLVHSDWRANPLEHPLRDKNGKIVVDEDNEQVMDARLEEPPKFGALPVIYGTAVSSLLALIFAVPLGMGAALFLVRICPRMLAAPVSFLVEFLAAIPSIAYGIWGVFVLAPFLRSYVERPLMHAFGVAGQANGNDMLAGGLVLGIMVVPIITAVSRDVLRAVPRAQIEGTQALGATWWQSSWEMLRYSRSGLFGAVMLALARAAGETMAVTMVIGNNAQIRASLFAPAQTMSSLVASGFKEASSDLEKSALMEVALILLVMSLLFNVVARYLVVGRRARTSAGH